MAEKFTDLLGQEYKTEVLKFLKDNPDDFFSINEIAEKTSGSNPSVKGFLEDLSDLGIVKFRKKAGSYLVEYNPNSRYDKPIKEIFRSETAELVEKANGYAFVLSGYNDIKDDIESIVLYGSVARGTADSNSDIDILVLVSNEANSEKIMDKALELAENHSSESIELVPMVQEIDEFRENWKNSTRFEQNVTRDGVILEGKEWDDILA